MDAGALGFPFAGDDDSHWAYMCIDRKFGQHVAEELESEVADFCLIDRQVGLYREPLVEATIKDATEAGAKGLILWWHHFALRSDCVGGSEKGLWGIVTR